MMTVKITHPSGWFKYGHWPYENHFPGRQSRWGNYKFEINNDIKECDVWVVHESIDKEETVRCYAKNVILITSEEKQQVPQYSDKYLDQFAKVITSRDDINHPHVIRSFYLSPWHVKKTYEELISSQPQKTEYFSAIISNNVSTAGHLKRYAFVNKLQGHFKDKMAWFGRGAREIEDKWDGLANFKYSLAIENCAVPYYFSEKILDCFCALTMPIYYGCPEITQYFPAESLIQIDIADYKKAIIKIEEAIEGDFYDKNLLAIKESRQLVLNKYQLIPALATLLDAFASKSLEPASYITLKPKNELSEPVTRSVISRLKTRFMKGFNK
jgi:hypothetical protein